MLKQRANIIITNTSFFGMFPPLHSLLLLHNFDTNGKLKGTESNKGIEANDKMDRFNGNQTDS